MGTRSWLLGALALGALAVLTGCASPVVSPGIAPTAASTAPLTIAATPSLSDGIDSWPGAAGGAVRCSGPVIGSTRSAPYEGEDTGATPEAALDASRRWASWSGAQTGLTFAREADDRRLYVLEVDGVVKQALILRHGPALKGDGSRDTVTRWWLESWARCDLAELPESVARENGVQLWSDRDGTPQLTSTILSFDFGAGCLPGMTALDLGGPPSGGSSGERRTPTEYLRDPAPGLRPTFFTDPYASHVTVPDDATDTGYERDGHHLWISGDRRYAYVGEHDDAEAWPRAVRPVRCA